MHDKIINFNISSRCLTSRKAKGASYHSALNNCQTTKLHNFVLSIQIIYITCPVSVVCRV